MVRHFLILENSETELSVDPRNGRRNNTTRSALDHRAVYNLQSDDGLVYFTAIGDVVKVQQGIITHYSRCT